MCINSIDVYIFARKSYFLTAGQPMVFPPLFFSFGKHFRNELRLCLCSYENAIFVLRLNLLSFFFGELTI